MCAKRSADTEPLRLTIEEVRLILDAVRPKFDGCLRGYDAAKYPEDVYTEAKERFGSLSPTAADISSAMRWKWGHWGKSRIPQTHANLIQEIVRKWPVFRESYFADPAATFQHWQAALMRGSRFISVAFITHLVHPVRVPIIDQHNFRAMNGLVRGVRRDWKRKKKPSTWADILRLGELIEALHENLEKAVRDVDKFLMVYGQSLPR